MPPYRDPNRLFYDPVDPVMLTLDQMQQLSPQELQAATDQLDQHLVLILQQIEENFAKCNQVVVESLLPAVEQHGENSMRIYESIKFWRPFFEAAASIRLHEPYADDTTSGGREDAGQTSQSPDRTVSSAGDQTYSRQSLGSEAEDLEGTPRASKRHDLSSASSSIPPEPHWSTGDDEFASPFLPSSSNRHPLPANSAMKQPSSSADMIPDQQLQRLRLRDLPPDSPDVPEPEFETAVFGGGFGGNARGTSSEREGPAGGSKGKGRDVDFSVDSTSSPSFSLLRGASPSRSEPRLKAGVSSPRNIRAGGGDKAHSKLLDKILRKNLASPAAARAGPGSSTPGRPSVRGGGVGGKSKQQFPPDVPREWNGIANLSQTALDAFPSPIKRRTSNASTVTGGEEDSFAQMMAAAVPPPSTIRSSSSSYLMSSPAPTRSSRPNPTRPNLASSSSNSRPPLPSSYSSSSPSKLTRTPAKYAAKLTARNVYESLGLANGQDSPLPSPPSILRTNHKPFNLYEHTQQQRENLRLSMLPPHQGGHDSEEQDHSPTTERTRSRVIDPSRSGGGGGRGGEPSFYEEGSVSNVHEPSIVQPPSFIANPDQSQTQPFNLYRHEQEQQRSVQRKRTGGGNEGGEQGFDREEEEDIDDLLFGAKTMTFKQERDHRTSIAPGTIGLEGGVGARDAGVLDFGGIVDDDEDVGGRGRIEGNSGERYEEDEYDEEGSYQEEGHAGGRGETERVGIVDEEQGEGRGEEDYHYQYGYGGSGGAEDESFNIERGLRGAGAGGGGWFGNRLLDGPEDTLFGMPQQHQQQQAQGGHQQQQGLSFGGGGGGSRYEEPEQEDTFTEEHQPMQERPYGAGFRLHGLSDMETLHGGELLASEPFQASPLAGKWGLGGAGGSQQ
ncbi:hypothetical protein JCM16303_000052 [Sporobolomyces ruberrimus]